MARSMSGRVQAVGSSLTAALPPARLTLASLTPRSPRSAFSMVITQAAQVIPATGTVSSSSLVCFSSCDMLNRMGYAEIASARLAPFSASDQVVQPLALRPQLLHDPLVYRFAGPLV